MNRRQMTGDHHGRTAGRATLLARAMDEILGRRVLTARLLPAPLVLRWPILARRGSLCPVNKLPAVQRPSSASPTVVTGPESLPMPG